MNIKDFLILIENNELQDEIDQVLDIIKSEIENEKTWEVIRYVPDLIQNFTDFDQETQKKLYVKDWEELFHLKFDKSARDYADSLLAKDLQSYSEQDKLFLKMISRQATFMMIKENVKGFDWWKSSPDKIKVVDRDNFSVPEMTFSASKLEKHGSSLEEFVSWLNQNGAKQIKRPQRKKPTFSQYD